MDRDDVRDVTCFRTARHAKSLLLKDVAAACETSVQYVSDIERGRMAPGRGVARCLKRVLGIPDREWDFYWWRRGKFPPDIPRYGDHEHVKRCLSDFRQAVTS